MPTKRQKTAAMFDAPASGGAPPLIGGCKHHSPQKTGRDAARPSVNAGWFIDWLSVTFRPELPPGWRFKAGDFKDYASVNDELRIQAESDSADIWGWLVSRFGDTTWRGRGFGRYKAAVSFPAGGVAAWNPGNWQDGLHCQFSARLLRSLPDEKPDAFLSSVLALGGRITRLDLAKDDVTGLVRLPVVESSFKKGSLTTRFKSFSRIRSGHRSEAGTWERGGDTMYLGHRSSQAFCRFYDKALQTGEKAPWVRMEFEFKAEKAHFLAQRIADGSIDPMHVVNGYLTFRDMKDPASRIERKRPAPWWRNFIGTEGRDRVPGLPRYDKGLEDLEAWLEKQISPSLARMEHHKPGTAARLLEIGKERLYKGTPLSEIAVL